MSVTPVTTFITESRSTYSLAKLPLTTIFTHPASCSSLLYTYWSDEGGTSLFTRKVNFSDPITSQCYPPNFGALQSAGGALGAQYSPGVCPSGFVAASTTDISSVHTSACCPSGATLVGLFGCFSPATTSSAVIFNTGTYTVSGSIAFVDYAVNVAWAASDLDSFTPASAPFTPTYTPGFVTASPKSSSSASIKSSLASGTASSAPVTSVSSSTASLSAAASSSATSATSSSGLSGGAIAGIVVGSPALIAIILAGFLFWLWRKKRNARLTAAPTPSAQNSTKYKPVSELDPHGVPPELPGEHSTTNELSTANGKFGERAENRWELPAN